MEQLCITTQKLLQKFWEMYEALEYEKHTSKTLTICDFPKLILKVFYASGTYILSFKYHTPESIPACLTNSCLSGIAEKNLHLVSYSSQSLTALSPGPGNGL